MNEEMNFEIRLKSCKNHKLKNIVKKDKRKKF